MIEKLKRKIHEELKALEVDASNSALDSIDRLEAEVASDALLMVLQWLEEDDD